MKRIFPLGLITLGFLLIFSAFGLFYVDNQPKRQAGGNLPDQVAGLNLTSSKSGNEATTEFTAMHGKEFPVTSGEIGYDGDGKATLWVAGTSAEEIAAEMVGGMQLSIAQGNSPFTPVDEIRDGDRTVYVLDGMGQKHYYFKAKNLVVWLVAEPSLAKAAIQQILEVYL